MKKTIIAISNHGRYVAWLYFGAIAVVSLGFAVFVGSGFVESIYAAVTTLTTVGFGDVTPELTDNAAMLFVAVAEILGVFVHAIVLSYFVGAVNLDKWTNGEQNKLDDKLDMLLKERGLEIPDDKKYE